MTSREVPQEPRFYDVHSTDGTRLRAWTNDVEGPPVLLCNGLGTNPYAWPALLRPDCGVRVFSWNHRGVGGSERPADETRVGIDAFVEDAVAVLDHAGLDTAVVAGWSIGVNTAFELSKRHADRVSGVFALAGVPGATFASMLGPLRVPRPMRAPITVGMSYAVREIGHLLSPATQALPMGRLSATVLRHSGFMFPSADDEVVRRAVREFLTTDVDWYFHLAVAAARHQRVSLRGIAVPATFVAGRHDVLAHNADIRSAAERIPGAVYRELPGSHFLQMEHPEQVHRELLDLVRRVDDLRRTGPRSRREVS
ncbi:MAG TPA: alpha/beta hydrolase [Nocardioidaceae bacterium]|nr:alpha/beta hydrolase [Nocardioidaceae bacterium]